MLSMKKISSFSIKNDKYADHLNEDYDQDGQFDKDEDG